MPTGTYARLTSRPSYAVLGIAVGAGAIDLEHTAQLNELLINNLGEDCIMQEGDRSAQVILILARW